MAGLASGTHPGVLPTPSRWQQKEAARIGRLDPPGRHGMQVWCGLADSREAARACLAPAMEAFYQLPFERFERYCPYGTADDVAEFLAPYSLLAARNSISSRSHLTTTCPLPARLR